MADTLMQTLSVALGMSLVFSLLSLLASSAVELVLAILDMRPRMLVQSLTEILAGASKDVRLPDKLLNHPVNRGLRQFGKRLQLPAYLSSAGFATALLDLLAPAPDQAAHDKASLRTALTAIPDDTFRAMMLGFVDEADGKLEVVKSRLADWFDNVQEQVRGSYARRSRWYLIIVAVVMVATLNLDSIRIGSALWFDPELRKKVATAAEQFNAERQKAEPVQNAPPQPSGDPATARLAKAREQFGDTREQFLDLGLPIGWTRAEFCANRDRWGILALCGNKILGLALTVLAISLGAPFWFDILNKLANLRANTGAKPMTEEDRSSQRKKEGT